MGATVRWLVSWVVTTGLAVVGCGEEFSSTSSTTTTTTTATGRGGSTTSPPAGGGGAATTATGQGGVGQGGNAPSGGHGGEPTTNGGAGGHHRSCEDRYGLLSDYFACGQPEGRCKFLVDPAGSSCDYLCRSGGADCYGAATASVVGSCGITGPLACAAGQYGLVVCECETTCAGGPICDTGPCSTTGCGG